MSIFNNLQNAIMRSSIAEKAVVNGKEISCVFFGYTTVIDQGTGALVTTNDPKICVKSSDISDIDVAQYNLVVVHNNDYYISDIQKDNEGVFELFLKIKKK